jgi:hypothetical protein
MDNLITHREPPTWEALEEAVRAILAECGMAAERQVPVDLPRGGVATVDVLAIEVAHGIATTTICECKNWKTNVPQEVIFGFRTVMIDAGANRGYVISKVGFQAGAILAAHATNIELVTFEQFQALYFDKWIAARTWSVERSIGGIGTYYEPFGIPGMDKIEDEGERDRYYQTWRKYMFVGVILPGFSPYMRTLGQAPPLPELPINLDGLTNYEIDVPGDLAAATGYQEFLELLQGYALEGLEALRALNPITRGKLADAIERDD